MRSVLPVAADLEPVHSVSLHKYDGLCSERKYLTCFFGLFFQFDTPLSKALDFL